MKTISIQDYANLIGYKGQNPTLEKIQEFAEALDLRFILIEDLGIYITTY